MELELTKEEIEVVSKYLAGKLTRLEDAGLEDSYCYPRILSFRYKLLQLEKELQNNEKICLQTK